MHCLGQRCPSCTRHGALSGGFSMALQEAQQHAAGREGKPPPRARKAWVEIDPQQPLEPSPVRRRRAAAHSGRATAAESSEPDVDAVSVRAQPNRTRAALAREQARGGLSVRVVGGTPHSPGAPAEEEVWSEWGGSQVVRVRDPERAARAPPPGSGRAFGRVSPPHHRRPPHLAPAPNEASTRVSVRFRFLRPSSSSDARGAGQSVRGPCARAHSAGGITAASAGSRRGAWRRRRGRGGAPAAGAGVRRPRARAAAGAAQDAAASGQVRGPRRAPRNAAPPSCHRSALQPPGRATSRVVHLPCHALCPTPLAPLQDQAASAPQGAARRRVHQARRAAASRRRRAGRARPRRRRAGGAQAAPRRPAPPRLRPAAPRAPPASRGARRAPRAQAPP